MKRIVTVLVLGLFISYLIMLGSVFARNEALCDKFVRIHVIADSDSPYDQAVKIGLRDNLFAGLESEFASVTSKEEALIYLNENKDRITMAANAYLESIKYKKGARVVIDSGDFPDKQYESFFLPGGKYDALKIIIGSGEGQNYFCVMFPPLCVTPEIPKEIVIEDYLTDGERRVVENGGVVYKSKVLELIKKIGEG